MKRFMFSPGDVVVADRGYSRRGELATVIRQSSDFIIRLNWANVPMMDESGKRFDLLNALRGIPEATVTDFNLTVKPDPTHDVPALPVRVVAVPKSEAAAAESRKKILKTAASLLDLDGLPAKDPSLASAFIYSKILAALLLDDLTQAFISFSPWGFVIQ